MDQYKGKKKEDWGIWGQGGGLMYLYFGRRTHATGQVGQDEKHWT